MIPRKFIRTGLAGFITLTAFFGLTVQAQLIGPNQPSSSMLSASLSRLFGENQSFTAKAEAVVQPSHENRSMTMLMDFAMRDGWIRTDFDTTQAMMQGPNVPPGAVEGLKKMGMDQMVYIFRPDDGKLLLVYPGLKAYLDLQMNDMPTEKEIAQVKLEKTKVGEETIDGHPCVKNRTVAIAGDGTRKEAMIWNAKDMKEFPVQIAFEEGGNKVRLRYKDIQLEKPGREKFEVPSGFTRHEKLESLMQVAMQRMLGSGGGFPGQPQN